jgi:hypothetical protein
MRRNRGSVASVKPTASPVPMAGKAQARSRLSNGRDVLPDVDGRSVVARRYRDIIGAVVFDQGGAEQLSEARLQLIRRFSDPKTFRSGRNFSGLDRVGAEAALKRRSGQARQYQQTG